MLHQGDARLDLDFSQTSARISAIPRIVKPTDCQEKIRIVLEGHAGILFATVPGSIVDNNDDS